MNARRAVLALWLATVACACASPRVERPALASTPHPEPAPREALVLTLPVTGTWIVMQGYHGAPSHHGRAAYALDLVKLDEAGRAYARQGKRTQDWYGFGAELLATADGVVVRAIDRFPDNRVMGTARDANTVIVQHTETELSEYVHLQQGSLRVREGERVRRGQVLARAGSSGAETPHLHWALLSSLDPIRTQPASFTRYEVLGADGVWGTGEGAPQQGQTIRAAP